MEKREKILEGGMKFAKMSRYQVDKNKKKK